MSSPAPRFVLFGAAHLGALVLTVLVAIGLVVLVRRRPGTQGAVRLGLAALLGALTVFFVVHERRAGRPWGYLAPLHLCDMALLVSLVALVTRAPLACELLYFWACAGTLLALVTPALSAGFPDLGFISYFISHGGVVVAALVLVWGVGCAPRPGAVWRAFLLTNLYAALVAAVNYRFDTNFLYLRAKPDTPSPLDWFGPWPVYLLVGEAVALVLFGLLALPFRRRRAAPGRKREGMLEAPR